MRYLALALGVFTLASCSHDANYNKQKYLDSGNRYFEAGRYNEAAIYYRKSITEDRRFGEAYYKLALTDLKLGAVPNAVRELRRAVELLPKGTADSDDATLKLCEIMVVAAQQPEHSEELLKEVQDMTTGLLKRNPNSWQGHKLSGDIALVDTAVKYKKGDALEAKKALADSLAEYRKALTAKPGDYIITLALGRTLMIDGESAEAESLFRSLIDKDKTNLNGYIELYRVYLRQQRLPDAEGVLKNAIKNNPKNTDMRLELARFYYGTNRKPELIALMNQMKADLKEFPDAYLQAGDFFIRVAQFDEAIKQFEEGIQKDSDRRNTYLKHEIEAYVRENKLDMAYAKNNEILKNDPKDPEARGLKATFALDKGEINQAMAELESVVTAKPNNFVAHFNLGRAHFARAEYEQARQQFEKAVELQPSYTPARLALTQVALLRGDNATAEHDADEILKVNPASIQGRIMKAAALQRLSKYDEARALLNPILAQNPKQEETLLELGVLDLNEKKAKDAVDLFRRAFEAQPNNIRGLLGQSKAYLMDGQIEKSVTVIQSESDKHPDRLDLLRELGNAQMAAGDFDSAIVTFQKVMAKLKDAHQEADIWARVAQAYRYKGDIQHSVAALEKSRMGVPENALTVTNLGILYEELGKKDVAKKYYEDAIRIDSNNALALNNLAYLIAESSGGDLNEALTYAQRAKQKLPNYSEITDTLGWIYMKKSLTDNALDQFKGLVIQAPQNPTFHYHYAMALNQKGDRESARKECQAALADRPNKVLENQIKDLMAKLG